MHTSIKLVNFDSTSIGNDKMNSDYSPKFNKGNKVFKGTMIRRPITEDPNKPFVVLGKNSKSGHFYLDRTKKRNSRYDYPNEASEVPASFKDNHQLNIAYSPKSIEFKQITKTEKVLPSRPNSTKPRPTLAKQWKSKAAKVDPSKSKSNIFIYNAENNVKVSTNDLIVNAFNQENNITTTPLIGDLLKSKFTQEELKSNIEGNIFRRNKTFTKTKSKPTGATKEKSSQRVTVRHKDEILTEVATNFAHITNTMSSPVNFVGDDNFEKGDNCNNLLDEDNMDADNNAEENKRKGEELFSSDNIIDTIKLISNNPAKFKHTSKILRELGQLAQSNPMVSDNTKDKEIMKDLKKSEQERQTLMNFTEEVERMIKETKLNKDEQSKRKIDEDKKRVEELVKLAKEEIKQKKSFDIEKLNKKDRELITRRMSYVPKQREPVKNIQCDEKESQDIKANDQLLLKSIEAIDRLKSPRQIIESVIEKIETNNQKLLEYVEKKAMNGFMLKAYQGLYDKGKKLNMEKVKKESKKKQINKDDMYDYIYTRGTKIKKSNTEKHPFLIEDD